MKLLLRKIAGRLLRLFPWGRRLISSSSDYSILSREQALTAQHSSAGWLQDLTARRQQDAYDALLREMRQGAPRLDLRVVVEAIKATGLPSPSVLEVGCGGGYYSEVLSYLLGEDSFSYCGIDYSEAMIDTARAAFPSVPFEVGDACSLPFDRCSYNIVFNSVSLMHILDFEEAIRESARVAANFCIYHSVPIFRDRPTTYLRKFAYGAPVVEIVFNRDELLGLFAKANLELVQHWQSIDYDVYPATPEHSTCETYLLRVGKRVEGAS